MTDHNSNPRSSDHSRNSADSQADRQLPVAVDESKTGEVADASPVSESIYAVTGESGHGDVIIMDEDAPMSRWIELDKESGRSDRWQICQRCGFTAPLTEWQPEPALDDVLCPRCGFDHADNRIPALKSDSATDS